MTDMQPGLDTAWVESLGGWFHLLTALLVAVDAPVPPVPSELFVIGSGAMSQLGSVALVPSVLAAWLGCWAGDIGLYALFRFQLTGLLDRASWGQRIHRGILRLLNKAGPAPGYASLFVLRFVSGGRTASMAAAGIAGIPWGPFLTLSGIGSAVWSVYMVGLGWFTGSATGLPFWASAVVGMGLGTLAGLIIAGIVAIRRRSGER
ncbi:Membrane protein DedA with SNARE-associated domain [Citricoccus sp. K5]|nr:Membrane protein DedA with SNARE-associated domain [Citricoccus sp. K5]